MNKREKARDRERGRTPDELEGLLKGPFKSSLRLYTILSLLLALMCTMNVLRAIIQMRYVFVNGSTFTVVELFVNILPRLV